MVVKNNQPPEHQILWCAVHHPKQKLFNLPLSLLNVLKYSVRVGCSNSMLKTVLIIFLTKHSLSTREFFENVSYHINTVGEKTRALQALKKFTRPVEETNKLRVGFKKKRKSQTWNIVPTGGEGVRHLEFSVPTSLSVLLSSISNFT